MEAYGDFAHVYDELMDNIPYEKWCAYLVDSINKYGVSRRIRKTPVLLEPEKEIKESCKTSLDFQEKMPDSNKVLPESQKERLESQKELLESEKNLVLDLGCGTGTLTQMLYDAGYDMIGVDNAEEMLSVAMAKREKSGREILYLMQDMRELELYSTVGTVISVCDSINYILQEEDLLMVFRNVNNYLYPGGLFIFDFNTVYKYEEVIGDTTIAENRQDCSFIWENYYHEEEEINEYDLTVFVREENGLFRKFTENHYQRGYRVEIICELLQEAGMELVEILDADTRKEVTPQSERVYVVARECRKQA